MDYITMSQDQEDELNPDVSLSDVSSSLFYSPPAIDPIDPIQYSTYWGTTPTQSTQAVSSPSTFSGVGGTYNDYLKGNAGISSYGGSSYGGSSYGGSSGSTSKAMSWVPQTVSGTTTTKTIGDLPEMGEYIPIDAEQVKSDTQQFSALGRREAQNNFQQLLSSIYGANPDDPYAQNLARIASQGFSMDNQAAISEGAKEAYQIGLEEQRIQNERQMTAYNAAVNAVLNSGTTTQTYEYSPTPMQAISTVTPNAQQQALSQNYYDPDNPYSLGQPYTYG